MKKKTTFKLLGLAAAGAGAAGGWTALGNYLYDRCMVPLRREPDAPEANDVQAAGRAWARDKEGFQDASIRSADGLALWAALVPGAPGCRRWALCVHGYHDTYESMGAIARWYHDGGWNVLLPDQRGHGRSQGECVSWGYEERLDVLSWASWIARRCPEAEIVLHGVSMGAASVLMASGGPMPRQVRAVISDCSYTAIEAEMRYLIGRWPDKPAGLPVPSWLLFAALRKAVLRRAGYDLRDAAPIQAVARSKVPTLFIHGVADDFVPASMMGKLYQAARCPKSFLWVPGAGHAAAVGTDPALYWQSVSAFLREHIPEAAGG